MPADTSPAVYAGRGGLGLRFWGPLAGVVILLAVGSLGWGRYPLGANQLMTVLGGSWWPWPTAINPAMETVVWQVRLPRILAALLIGGGLSVSGAAFQGVFRNPLVSPFILGVASGAGCGAALAILLLNQTAWVQGASVAGGTLAVLLTYGLSRLYQTSHTLVLVLAGVIVGTFFSSMISMVKYLADPYDKLPVIVYWLLGSLATVGQADLWRAGPPMVLGVVAIWMVRWRLNLLTLGEDEARALGVETARLRLWVVSAATVITACAVSISGIIGWVGLVIPHLARMLYGPDHRRLVPAALCLGGAYLVLIDDLARSLGSGEVPLGILTATVGAPVFALALKKTSLGWAS